MAHKPENDGESAKSLRNKAKSTPAIDLPASEIAEVKPEAAAAEEASPAPEPAAEPVVETAASPETPAASPPPPTPSKLVPGLIGLVAGAIGGFAAYHIGEFSRPKAPAAESALVTRLSALEQRIPTAKLGDSAAPQALIERLEKAEALLADAGKREATLRTDLGKMGQALATESAERKKAVETLAKTAPAAPVGLVGNAGGAEIDGLKSRIGTVEALQPKLDTVEKSVQDLTGRIAGLSTRDALGAANARLAAVTLLEDGFSRSRPLGSTLDLLKNLGADAAALGAFAPFAASGAPDARKLLEELRALAPPPRANAAPANQSLVDKLKQGALSLVEVRRAGDITGTDDAAHLARMEQALQRGDVTAAAGLAGRLSAAAAPIYAAWRAKAEGRVRAGEALVALRGEAVSALAKAASAK